MATTDCGRMKDSQVIEEPEVMRIRTTSAPTFVNRRSFVPLTVPHTQQNPFGCHRHSPTTHPLTFGCHRHSHSIVMRVDPEHRAVGPTTYLGDPMELTYREAAVTDVLALVKLFADDPLGAQREDVSEPINPAYLSAFASISADPNNELMVIESSGRLVGTLQLTYLPNLTRLGSWRCQIEGVRIHRDFRGQGLGTRFFEWVVDRAEKRGCHLVQLTSDKQRPEALKFYENLGFQATHEGFKLKIND